MPKDLSRRILSPDLEFLIPSSRTMDFNLQFDSKAFRRYYCDMGIKNRYSTPAYPQVNGQAKAINKVVVGGLKKRLDDVKGKWVKELSHGLHLESLLGRRPF